MRPDQPVIMVTGTTSKSIHIKWQMKRSQRYEITKFRVHYRPEDSSDEWIAEELSANDRSFLADDLLCGSRYSFYVTANGLKREETSSALVSAKTNGSGIN